jgi:DNA-binding MarR family transcriptional regulator/GNAT superfamily N-acetyltransferase
MDAAEIQQVRGFNRTVTQRLGALNDEYLARSRPLGASRVLAEIGAEGTDVRAIRTRLDLDSGYLSRLLRSLEAEGLVRVRAGKRDSRIRFATLTAAGRSERRELDRLSDDLASSLLEPLTAAQRAQVVDAMTTVQRLLTASQVAIDVADPMTADAQQCISSYFVELGDRFDDGFDPVASTGPDAAEFVPPSGLLLVARLHGEPVACGALRFHEAGVADIKRMWVAPATRGLGLGRRMLLELEQRASEFGAGTVRLETNRNLTQAINLYRTSGFVEVEPFNDEPYAHHWFAKDLGPATR